MARPAGVRERVVAIIAAQALVDPADVADGASPASLGIDSMGLVEVIFAVEEAFGVSVPFNANRPDAPGFDVSTVSGIVAAVEGLVAARA